jgi:mRNA interferase RelE/StbE
MYKIKLTKITAENLQKIDSKTQKQIINKIDSLKTEPLFLGKRLKGSFKEFRAIRAAGQRYRIIIRFKKK